MCVNCDYHRYHVLVRVSLCFEIASEPRSVCVHTRHIHSPSYQQFNGPLPYFLKHIFQLSLASFVSSLSRRWQSLSRCSSLLRPWWPQWRRQQPLLSLTSLSWRFTRSSQLQQLSSYLPSSLPASVRHWLYRSL